MHGTHWYMDDERPVGPGLVRIGLPVLFRREYTRPRSAGAPLARVGGGPSGSKWLRRTIPTDLKLTELTRSLASSALGVLEERLG